MGVRTDSKRSESRVPSDSLLRLQMKEIGELQHLLLPRHVPQPVGWEVAAFMAISPWPGGDYYDFLPLPGDRLGLVVADASGHGGPSAVMVAQVRTMLHTCPLTSGRDRTPFCPLAGAATKSPGVILGHLNGLIGENCLADQFMTAFYGVLDPCRGTLCFACAGHPLPRHWHAAAALVRPIPDIANRPLGIEPGVAYEEGTVALEPGDVLVLYTDGLTEAMNEEREQFGVARLDAAIREAAALGAEATLQHIHACLEEFLAGHTPDDDLTLMVLQRKPLDPPDTVRAR